MIIEIEDRFCKAVQVFSKLLDKVQCSAKRAMRSMRLRR